MAPADDGESTTFGLDKVLEALSRDLRAAADAAKEANLGLAIRDVEVELAFTVERDRSGGVGVNLKVFGVGASGGGKKGSSEESVQRIKLKLQSADGFIVAGPDGTP